MKREEYEYAKRNNPDWDKVISEDIKTWSKLFIFDSVLAKKEHEKVMETITKRINAFVDLIDDADIRRKYTSDLLEYATKVWKWADEHIGKYTKHALSLAFSSQLTKPQIRVLEKSASGIVSISQGGEPLLLSNTTGAAYNQQTSGGMYYKEVQKRIKEEINGFLNLDPKTVYYANVNPRSMAEMLVRFNIYKQKKQDFISRGVSLVYVPPHSNCSKRCEPYQGRIYSLNGTSGTIDGRKYVPIEEVSDNVTYTSKNTGKTYYCGLFSYNCRHDMEEYREGMNFASIPKEVIEKTREIESEQRRMERDIRSLREREELYRILGNRTNSKEVLAMATKFRKLAAQKREEYEQYSRKNRMAYFPSRLQIVAGENRYVRTVGKNDELAKKALQYKTEAEA
jgi:hypothetical protein